MLVDTVPLDSERSLAGGFSRRSWLLLAFVFAIIWFANLDVRKLQHPDEGRYAEIAREMVATGDYVTPRLNGIKYFEKPPLQYWLTAASFRAFELDEWTARLPSALSGFLTLVIVGYVGSVIASPVAGAYAAVALAGCVWPFGVAHMVTLDALLTFWLTLALGSFLLAQHQGVSPGRRRAWILLAWAATAGGMLTKGLVALVIPFCTLVLHTLVTRDVAPWKRLHVVPGLLLFLALSAPWFIVVSSRNPDFARFFFIHEHFERFLTTEHRRTGAWWYFLPLLAVGLLPWTGFFLWDLRRSWRSASAQGTFAWVRFCLLWCAFVLVFFSASGSKLPSYILPIFPAAALVLGAALERATVRTLGAFAAVTAAVAVILWSATVLAGQRIVLALSAGSTPAPLLDALTPWIMLALGVASVGNLAAWVAFRRNSERGKGAGIIALSLTMMLTMQVVYTASDLFRATRSAFDLVRTLENASNPPYDPGAPFFQVRMYDQTLPYYLRRTTTLVEYRDELGPGLDAEPSLAIPREADWIARWDSLTTQGYALMARETFDELKTAGVPMRVVASDFRRVLAARH